MAAMGPHPPPPPPAPGKQGPGIPPFPGNMRPPPPPAIRPPGAPGPGPQQFQIPMRPQVNSTRVVDITPRKPLDEDACKKKLTSFDAYTIRKIIPRDSKEVPTWAKCEITKEPLSPEDIVKAVHKLNETRRSVQEKKAALRPFQQGQVNRLMDELITAENDHNFEWSLAQLDRKEFTNRKGQRETSIITVYVKRGPLKDLNPIGLFNALERVKAERMAQMNRPPPPLQPQQPGGAGAAGIINMGAKDAHKSRLPRPKRRGSKSYHHDESSSSSYFSSDTESGSDYSSSENTEMSDRSGRYQRKHSHRGHERPREHRRKFYIDERVVLPESRRRDSMPYGAQPRYVPEVPLAIPVLDPVAVAYQAGKNDADAERLSNRSPARSSVLVDPVAAAYQAGKDDADAERFALADRYPPRMSVSEPRAIVSYGRPERRFETRYSEPRYAEEVRYDDLREEDYIRREERRRREAEEYMDRRPSEPKIIYTNPNPFAPTSLPRRYAPSYGSGW